MKDLLTSPGLLERLDISGSAKSIVVAKFISGKEIYEISGDFIRIIKGETLLLEFLVESTDAPFKILGANKCRAIIKSDMHNLGLNLNLSSIEISGNGFYTIQLTAEVPYEIKTV